MRETGNLKSSDGKHTLQWFSQTPSEAAGAMLIVHGMAEYKERYEYTALRAAEDGIACYCYDQLGHGQTTFNASEHGYFGETDGVKHILEDVHNMLALVRSRHPDVPLILLGHSMGSFIVRLYATEYGDIDLLCVSGTSAGNPALGFGLTLSKLIKKLYGGKHVSKLLDRLAMGGNSKRFKNEELPGQAWLSREPSIRRDMTEKSFPFTCAGMADMFTILKAVSAKEWYEKFPKKLPVYLFSGSDDPVGDYGVGFTKVCGKLKAAGADVSSRLWESGRHETLNETNRDEVLSELFDWINPRINVPIV